MSARTQTQQLADKAVRAAMQRRLTPSIAGILPGFTGNGYYGWTLLLALFCLVVNFQSSFASPADYLVHGWQTEGANGLPENKIMAMVQTRDGYLWLGTYSGLARFDGVRFVVFDNSNTPEMHDSSVTSLFEAEDGALWIGHATGELTCRRNGRFEAVEVPAHWSGGKIHSIGADEAGDIWLLNETGLLARLKDGLVLTPPAGTATNLLAMATSKRGPIWVARAGRLSHLENGRIAPFKFPGTQANSYVQGICASRDGGLWVASDQRLRKWKDSKWVADLGSSPWNGTPIHTFIETKAGRLAAGTSDHGFYLIDPAKNGQSVQFCRTNGFDSDWIVSLSEDNEGGLWVGTGGAGVFAVRPRNVHALSPPDQWQSRAVLSVSPGRDGTLWMGTEGAGLYRLQNGRWENFAKDAGIRNPYIWSVIEDPQGEVWAGTWGGSLYQKRGDLFEHAPNLEGLTTPMPAVLSARQGGLWVGTGMGLLRYHAGEATWFRQENGRPLKDVRTLIEEVDGTVWFGMYGGGLGWLKEGQVRVFRKPDGLASDFVQCLHLDRDGALWIGTFGGGLSRLKQGRFIVINRQQGLPNDVICDIEEDGQGFFWMSSHGGILRVNKEELNRCADGLTGEIHCLTYGLSDGLPTLKCSGGLQPAGCKTPDGRLWFATSKGLVTLDPQNVETNPLAPPVVIESLWVDDQLAVEGAGFNSPLKIPPGRHRLEFQFTGLSFVAPEKVKFKHRLEGWEPEWMAASAKRTVNYSYIPPGNYTFHVTACNNDGVWNETGAAFAFTVLPFFWQTLWFRILGGVTMVAAGGGIVLLATRRRMQRKLERLEQQRAIELERARIAQDIHDDLGAHLTRITMLSESARGELDDPAQAEGNINQIYDTARELTRAMDEIVWAVNPKHDMLESLANYLEKFAVDFLEPAGIRCRLDMPLQFPVWPLTAEVRHNLFLAFKEAMNNVAKHAAASEVRITLAVQTSAFTLAIEDNGRGFAMAVKSTKPAGEPGRYSSGNGLPNMRKRLSDIGGKCEIVSAPGQGTKVVFAVSVKSPANKISAF